MFKIICASLLVSSFAVQVYAIGKFKIQGAVDGGGGKAVVCKDTKGEITSVRLLDLWEAETLYDLKPKDLASTIEESIAKAIAALKNSYEFNGSMGRSDGNCANQDCVQRALEQTANIFLGNSDRLKRVRGLELIPTDDSYEFAKPKNCDILQIVNYRPNRTIFLDQDLFEKMSAVDQVALIIHESYYSFLRDWTQQESNSIRTRRAVGFVMNGNEFLLETKPANYKGGLFCSKVGTPYAPTYIYFYEDKIQDQKFISSYIEVINRSQLIGVKQPFGSFSTGETGDKELLSGKCSGEGTRGIMRVIGTGAVEFDHICEMQWVCKDQKITVHLTDSKPGGDVKTFELACVPIQQN